MGANPKPFKKKLLATSISSCLLAAGGQVFAQGEQVEEVFVTGMRASLQQSMNVKRESSGVVDAITAEDIGRMPDANLAESLQRIAGVSISRTNGEGARVTVRGIDPSLNMVTLNGRNMPTVTNDGTEGDKSNRAFDFAMLASESINGVTVYKTGKADVSGGGLGATINLQTIRPLDAGTRGVISAKAISDQSVHNGSGDGSVFTPEISGVYSWVNDSETFGLAVTGAFQERHSTRSNAFVNNWQFREAGTDADNLPAGADITNRPQAGQYYAVPTDLRYALEDSKRERTNAQATLQFRPIESFTATVDYTYSQFDVTADRSQQSTWYNVSAIDSATFDTGAEVLTPVVYHENYTDDAGLSTGKDVSFAQQDFSSTSEMNSFGLNLEWSITDSFTVALDHHNSSADNVTERVELGLNANVVTSEYSDWRNDMPVMGITFNDLDPNRGNGNGILDGGDVSSAMGSVAYDTQNVNIKQTNLSADWNIGEFIFFEESNLAFGYDTREDKNAALVNGGTTPRITMGNWGGVNPTTFGANWPSYFSTRNFGDSFPSFDETTGDGKFLDYGLDGDFDRIKDTIEWVNQSGVDPDNFNNFVNGKIQRNGHIDIDRTIKEDVEAYYAQFSGGFDIAGMASNLVIGVRQENTDVTSVAVVAVPENQSWDGDNDWSLVSSGVQEDYKETNSYDNFLPNVDFDISPTDALTLRASYSETMARPGYAQLRPDVAIDNQYLKQASGGNPQLVALESSNIDLSVEWYYGDDSYLSAAYFTKDVKNFIGNDVVNSEVYGLRDPRLGERFEQAIAAIEVHEANGDTNPYRNQPWDSNSEQHQHDKMLEVDGQPVVEGNSILANGTDPVQQWLKQQPLNQQDSSIDGLELSVQHWFGETGFGVQANYTYVDSDLEFDNTSTEEQFALIGLSDTANLVGFYDKNGLQIRVAYNWRDEFLSSTTQGGNNAPGYTEAYSQVDFSVSYDVSDNLSVMLEGLNVTGEDSRLYGRSERQMFSLEDLGARYAAGVRYTF
ncbi:TonB-dependent receptor [Alteromonadaceae bacterium Bs31]|nr:TonB-dependent receptor [Alteromonadaceae bacterium Bs31]